MTTLSNALRLLSMLRQEPSRLRVSDAARELGLPKSSVSRLLKELAEARFVERDLDGRSFRAGPELFRLGNLYRARIPIEERIDGVCQDFVRRYPATAYVGVLRGADLIVLRRHEGPYPVRFIQEPGSSIPAYATAVGKALLARLPEDEFRRLLPARLVMDSRDVNTTRQALLKELREAAKLGYTQLDDRILGVGAIGVAVQMSPGRNIGFAICYSREAVTADERAEIAGALTHSAQAIGALCEDPFWMRRQ